MNHRTEFSISATYPSKRIMQANSTEQLMGIIKNSTATVILIAIGIFLPWITHRFGFGMAFLPMHLPLLIGSFLLPPGYACLLAFIIPITNTALTGMPVLFPSLPMIIVELITYVLTINYLYKTKHYNIFLSLVVSLLFGRIAATIMVLVFKMFIYNEFNITTIYLRHLIYDFLPGIVLQLSIVPLLAIWLARYFRQSEN